MRYIAALQGASRKTTLKMTKKMLKDEWQPPALDTETTAVPVMEGVESSATPNGDEASASAAETTPMVETDEERARRRKVMQKRAQKLRDVLKSQDD